MNEELGWRLAAVAFLVGANGFFVAAEFALVTVRRTRIEQLANEGNSRAKVVKGSFENLDRYIAGTQVGITLASLALGWIGEPALAGLVVPLFETWGPGVSSTVAHTIAVAVAFTIITFLHVILGELVPKSVALQKPEATALALAKPLAVAVTLFHPLIWSLNGLGNLLLRAIGLKVASGLESVHSAKELELLVRESHKAGILDDLEKRMLQRTFRFSETSVVEVMVPRSEMTALDLNLPLDELLDRASDAKHSRLPAYTKSSDQTEGVLYAQELFRLSRRMKGGLREILRTPLFVPETMHLDDLIERFRTSNMQMAIVVDEHGGTAGLVTLEDIIEAVFGRIQDQNEDSTPEILSSKGGIITIQGDTRLVELVETFGWKMDFGDVDTVGGYVMDRLGRVPNVGDEFEENGRRFRVTKMARNRVVEVVATPMVNV